VRQCHPWTPEEIAKVESLAGDVPWMYLAQRYNNWSGKNGYPIRSLKAITHVCARHGVSTVPNGDYVTTGYIADVLGISIRCVQEWLRHRLLPYKQSRRVGPRYVRRTDLRELAASKPHLFAGISIDRLNALIEDLDLAHRIAATYPDRVNHGTIHKPRRVRCVETGQVFNSISEASRAVYVRHQVITRALKNGWRAGGYRWEEVK
jgi:DNA-binding transcriptional MerR regulator